MTEAQKSNMLLCLEEVRRFDHDRFLTLAFAPASKQPALLALYAFNIEIARIAELVSEPMLGQIRLQWWRETIEAMDKGEARGHAVAGALAEARESAAISSQALLQLLDARERDLDDTPLTNLAALEGYAENTSSAVIAVAVEALGGERTDYALAIKHGGIAYALTGLLRALPSHASQGRLFLPADMLNRHSVDPHDVFAGRMTPGLRTAMDEMIETSHRHLVLARRGTTVPRALRAAFLPISLCDPYLDLMGKPDFNPFVTPTEVLAFRRQLRLLGRSVIGKF
jgi:phytoene synthase